VTLWAGLEAKAIKPTQCRRCAQMEPLNAMASVESHGPEPGSTRRSSASTAGASARRAPPAGRPAGGSIEPSSNAAVAPRWNSAAQNVAAGSCFRTPGHTAHVITATRKRNGEMGYVVGAVELERLRMEQQRPRERTYVKGGGQDRRTVLAVATRIATKAAAY
jgi:hypothetical protein